MLPGSGVSRFLDVDYPLPGRLLEGKRKITVRFQSTEDREVAPVFGIRLVRAQAR